MRATVILPCRDVADTLAAQLRALDGQVGDVALDVVVVDDGSVDGTAAVAAATPLRWPMEVVRNPHPRNVATARNLGARHASGDVLLFCDGDDVVGPGWAHALVDAVRDRDVLAAGRTELGRLNPGWTLGTRAVPQQHGLQEWADPPYLPHAGGGNLAIRRDTFERLGGFDEDVGLRFSEAADLCWRAQLSGVPLLFVPDGVLHVRLQSTLRGVYRQARGWGEGSIALHRKFAVHGMPAPSRLRGLAGWLALPLRLARVRDRAGIGRVAHLLGWKVGRLRGSLRHRYLAL